MDANSPPRMKNRTVAILLLTATVVGAIMPHLGKSGELHIYMQAAERITRGEQIYRPDDAHAQAFTYPPFFALATVPLVPLPPMARASVWCIGNLVLAGIVVIVLARLAWPTVARGATQSAGARGWVFALVVAVLSTRFFISPLEYQSHDMIVLALVVLAASALANGHDVRAGVFAGLAAACKATPLLLLPLFCWQRRFRAAASFLAAMVLATLLPDLLFPAADGHLWVAHWYDNFISKVQVGASTQAAGAWSPWNLLDQSLSGTIARLTTPVQRLGDMFNVCVWQLRRVEQQRLTLALEALIAGWLAWCTWPRRQAAVSQEPGLAAMAQFGIAICAMLLLSPMSGTQHFCGLVVPITACATFYFYIRRDRLVAAALIVVFVLGTLAARDLLGRYAAWPQAVGAKTWCAAALLLACGRTLTLRAVRPIEEKS
jgi:hypothetical protein